MKRSVYNRIYNEFVKSAEDKNRGNDKSIPATILSAGGIGALLPSKEQAESWARRILNKTTKWNPFAEDRWIPSIAERYKARMLSSADDISHFADDLKTLTTSDKSGKAPIASIQKLYSLFGESQIDRLLEKGVDGKPRFALPTEGIEIDKLLHPKGVKDVNGHVLPKLTLLRRSRGRARLLGGLGLTAAGLGAFALGLKNRKWGKLQPGERVW